MARKDNRGRNLKIGESQRSDGRYMYRYLDNKTGIRQTIYSMDLAELREMEEKIAYDTIDGIDTSLDSKKVTVNELFERYISIRELRDTTRQNYIAIWNNHIKDGFGNMKVIQVKPSNVKQVYARLSKADYSRSTIKVIHDMLYPVFEMAVEDDLIRKNPAKMALKDYGVDPKKKEALSEEQQKRLFEFVGASNVYNCYLPMLEIMIGTAVRCGELIGLTWHNVDMEAGEITINHQLVYKDYGDGYKFHISEPKTNAGKRTIPMTRRVKKAFAKIRKQQFILGVDRSIEVDGLKDFVFTGKNGLPMMPSAVNNVLYNIVEAYNKAETINAKKERRKASLLPKFSAHIMRHTGCTRMAEQGMDAKVLQYIMGHANVQVTMDVYNHITSKERIENEIKKMEDLMVI